MSSATDNTKTRPPILSRKDIVYLFGWQSLAVSLGIGIFITYFGLRYSPIASQFHIPFAGICLLSGIGWLVLLSTVIVERGLVAYITKGYLYGANLEKNLTDQEIKKYGLHRGGFGSMVLWFGMLGASLIVYGLIFWPYIL